MSSPREPKQKAGVYRDATVWLASPAGTVDADAEEIKGPAVRVTVQERYLPDEDPVVSLGFCVSAEFLAAESTEWELLMTREERTFETKREHDALTRGLGFARDHVASLFTKSTDPSSLYALLCTINDDGRECVRANRGGGRKEFRPLYPEDHALALGILQKHFAQVFRNLNVAFRLREEVANDETVEWTKGRAGNGGKLKVEAICEKVSSEKRILLKHSMGFAPHFLITIDAQTWGRFGQQAKARLLYHELSHIGYDSEKDTWYIAEHDITEFAGVVNTFGLGSEANGRTFKFYHDTKGVQLSLLGEEKAASAMDITRARIANQNGNQEPGKEVLSRAARQAAKEFNDVLEKHDVTCEMKVV